VSGHNCEWRVHAVDELLPLPHPEIMVLPRSLTNIDSDVIVSSHNNVWQIDLDFGKVQPRCDEWITGDLLSRSRLRARSFNRANCRDESNLFRSPYTSTRGSIVDRCPSMKSSKLRGRSKGEMSNYGNAVQARTQTVRRKRRRTANDLDQILPERARGS